MGYQSGESKIILYQADGDKIKVDVFFAEENFRMTQKNISDLFNVDRTVITKHLRNVFNEGELDEKAVCANYAHTANCTRYPIKPES